MSAAAMLSSAVEDGPFVCLELGPVGDSLIPGRARGGEAAAHEVGEGGSVGGDHAGTGSRLDGHIADGHAAFHGEGADGGAGVLDDVAGGPRRCRSRR